MSPWLLREPDPTAVARLFCFPYSGCGASMYHRWPRRVGDVDICPIQLPARENRFREPHYGTYGDLADALVDALPPYLGKPFGFFGHCGGALPGVEVTRQLRDHGLPLPRRLFISSQVAPHDGPYGRFLTLGRNELAGELVQLIANLGGKPAPALVELGLDLMAKDIEANRRYHVPVPERLPCGITVIGWTGDDEIPMATMRGWSEWSADCRFDLLEGGHYRFLHPVEELFAAFASDLTDPPTAGSSGAPPPAGA